MTVDSALKRLTAALAAALTFASVIVAAQDTAAPQIVAADQCAAPYSLALLNASNACVGQPFGYVCNAGGAPAVEPPGPVANSLAATGALVETGVIESVRTPPLSVGGGPYGIAYLRVAVEDSPVTYSALLLGDVSVRNVTPPEFPAWQAIQVETVDPPVQCESAPFSTLILQNPVVGNPARLVVNGVSIDLNGTLAVQTTSTATTFFTLSGTLRAVANGVIQAASAGQEMRVDHAPGDVSQPLGTLSAPAAFNQDRVNHLPLPLFDRPIQVAQGGVATTTGAVNLRTGPSTDFGVIVQVPAQTRVTLLGRNEPATWYHVRIPDGTTGWMLGELLIGDFSQVTSAYEATPQPVQRLGDLGQKARVIAPNGFDLRVAPDIGFPVINYVPPGAEVSLIARSPYSPWVEIHAADGVTGWIALLAIETRAVIDALPIDFDVPPPPEPTRIPGTFGNAFPDPNCYPNCTFDD